MERTKLLTFAVIGLLLLNLLTIGFLFVKSDSSTGDNQQPGSSPDDRGPARLIIERLHLDDQQRQEYVAMARQHHEITQRLNKESVRLFQAYYSLLTVEKPDSAKASALVRQITDIQRQIAELNFAHFQQIRALCRPNQQAYFTQLVGDLARLFGRQQRPPRRDQNGPPEAHPEGPPENSRPRP